MRIVQLEGESLIADVRRPAFDHEWVEYPGQRRASHRTSGRGDHCHHQQGAHRRRGIAALPELKMIAISATGTNNVDLDACRERGIVVSNIRGYAGHTVPEHVMALCWRFRAIWWRGAKACRPVAGSDPNNFACSIIRSVTCMAQRSASLARHLGQWRRTTGRGLRHARTARRAQGAAVVRPGYTAFAEVLAEADAISLHCPLTAETTGLIGESSCKP
jgi:glycerate dehydrogenase